jgi:hypothetical protein
MHVYFKGFEAQFLRLLLHVTCGFVCCFRRKGVMSYRQLSVAKIHIPRP